MYEKVHELVWIKLNESKCTVKQWNFQYLPIYLRTTLNYSLICIGKIVANAKQISGIWLRSVINANIRQYSPIKVKVNLSQYRLIRACTGPEGSRMLLRLPGYPRQSAHEGGNLVRPTYRPSFTPKRYSWYSFLLESESTSEPSCGRKD